MLARLEQVWDAAVASGSAYMMLRVLRFQAEMAGLDAACRREPGGGSGRCRGRTSSGRFGAGEAHERQAPNPGRSPRPCGGDRPGPERALARHCESREAMEAA